MRINERVIQLNDKPVNADARYVLYWMQMYKRVDNNHSLIYAIRRANELKLPLVVYEGLKYYYPWASDRLHTFILEGVEEKRLEFERLGIRYVFYLQKDADSPKNTVASLAKDAALIVTDDFPCFIIPEHNRRIAERAEIPVFAVDSNGIIPMSKFDKEEYAAYTIRPKINKLLDRYLKPLPNETVEIPSVGIEVDCPETHRNCRQHRLARRRMRHRPQRSSEPGLSRRHDRGTKASEEICRGDLARLRQGPEQTRPRRVFAAVIVSAFWLSVAA